MAASVATSFINLSNVLMQGVRSPAVTIEQLDLAFFGDHPDVPPLYCSRRRWPAWPAGKGPWTHSISYVTFSERSLRMMAPVVAKLTVQW